MQQSVRLRGGAASIVRGYVTAVTISRWSIVRQNGTGRWLLAATIARVDDPFHARQKPLQFTAPRPGGFWCWGIESITIQGGQLHARLGPPEQ